MVTILDQDLGVVIGDECRAQKTRRVNLHGMQFHPGIIGGNDLGAEP